MDNMPHTVNDLIALGNKLRDPHDHDNTYTAWAANLLEIRDRNGNFSDMQLNAAQLEFEGRHNQRSIVLKARQMGMTTWIAGRFFLKTITTPGTMTVQVAQTREAAEGIFRMVQRFYDRLPDDLRKELRRNRNNVGQMAFTELESEFRILSAADPNAGRGLTIQNLHCSELSRWPGDAAATLAGLRAALSPAGELVMESTPNGACGCFYDEWTRAEEGGVVQHFLPWWKESAYVAHAVPAAEWTGDESALVALHGLTPEQIGYRRTLEASYRGMRAQEFAEDAESCFRASGECCFELDAIMKRLDDLAEPMETKRNRKLHIWYPPQPGRTYIVAADPAGGGADGDYSAVQVIDTETGIQCAELREHLAPLELAHACAGLAREYNGALLVIERNNHGSGVIAHLSGNARYENVYLQNGAVGWYTSAISKPEIVSRMGDLLVDRPNLFHSRRLLAECRTFVTHAGGRTGASSGAHDDLLMAMAIAHGVRHELLQRSGRTSRR